jgi:hypothetical protein
MEKADYVIKYCRDWSFKYNLNTPKILTFNKGGKLKKNERWAMYGQTTEVTN